MAQSEEKKRKEQRERKKREGAKNAARQQPKDKKEVPGQGACQGYTLQTGVDAFKGRCDLGREGPAATPEECCAICSSKKTCRAFTHTRRNDCYLKNCGLGMSPDVLIFPGATSGYSS